MKKQFSFLLRVLFWDALAVLCLLTVAANAKPAPYTLSVYHNATERGVISPGCAAVVRITGGTFAAESQQFVRQPLPLELAGVSVTIGGLQAQIRFVSPDTLAIIAPNVPLPVSKRRVVWFPVVVTTFTDRFTGWAAFAPTAPGIYEQMSGKTRHVQGHWRFGQGLVYALDGSPILAGSRVALLGSGMRDAKTLRVWIDDGFDLWIVEAQLNAGDAATGSIGWAGFPWIEGVAFDLPKEAKGNLTLVVQADLMWSQEIFLATM